MVKKEVGDVKAVLRPQSLKFEQVLHRSGHPTPSCDQPCTTIGCVAWSLQAEEEEEQHYILPHHFLPVHLESGSHSTGSPPFSSPQMPSWQQFCEEEMDHVVFSLCMKRWKCCKPSKSSKSQSSCLQQQAPESPHNQNANSSSLWMRQVHGAAFAKAAWP